MQAVKGLMAATLAAALLLTSGSAKAGTIVLDDSGGGSLMTVTGTTTGGTLIGNSSNIVTDEVDGVTGLSLPTSYSVTITGALSGGVFNITNATGSSTIGTGGTGSEAELTFNNLTGSAFNVGTTGYIVLTGTINSVPLDNYAGYSFNPSMVGAEISLTVTKTGTNYTDILGEAGAMVANSGFGFQQADGSVPEPASMILLGLGVGGLLVFRQVRRRTSVVCEKG
jgi:hypothetical protein